jgi:leucyl-tRNA synthetase
MKIIKKDNTPITEYDLFVIDNAKKLLSNEQIVKIIYVPNKIVNFIKKDNE